jgi:hypothetical protein
MVTTKIRFPFFSPKNSFAIYFVSKTSKEHPTNLVKSINDLQKHKKTLLKTQNKLETKYLSELNLKLPSSYGTI